MQRSLATAASLTLAALGVLTGVFVAVTPASAGTDTITSVAVSDPATPNGAQTGDLTVVVDSTTSITALTAHLVTFSSANPADYLDPVLTETGTPVTLADGDTESTWSVATPIATDQLAVGLYQVNLVGTFADSASFSDNDAGVFSFADQLTITAAADHTQVSYDDKTVTVTGSVTSLAPARRRQCRSRTTRSRWRRAWNLTSRCPPTPTVTSLSRSRRGAGTGCCSRRTSTQPPTRRNPSPSTSPPSWTR